VVAFGGRGLSPDAKPKYINTGETPLFSKGQLLYRFGPAREAAGKGAPLIVSEGYMDVIALAEAGFLGAVAPLGTALTEDQLQMLWRVVPEPILCFDGDEAGLRAGTRAMRLALPHLAPGHSLRFAFLPKGEDPDSFIRSQGAPAMSRVLDKAEPLADVLWKSMTAGKDFSTPERRAGLEQELSGLVKLIRDGSVASYYRRDFETRVFAAFKQRQFPNKGAGRQTGFRKPGFQPDLARDKFQRAGVLGVSDAVKMSPHALNADAAARRLNERRLLGLLLLSPHLIEGSIESLASLALDDPQLDRLRHELLNLAASGARLDKDVLERHLVGEEVGKLTEQLTTEPVLLSNLKGQPDAASRETLLLRMIEQIRDGDGLMDRGSMMRWG
jgi:DNA primase